MVAAKLIVLPVGQYLRPVVPNEPLPDLLPVSDIAAGT